MEIVSNTNLILWIGIGFCITQSAMLSGLNLAFFSVPRLRLEIEAANNNKAAIKVLRLRENSNFLFSTIVITFFGEIIPQAYFSRHALKMASRLSPVLIFYQYLLYPVTKPSALMLNWMVGQESIHYFKEKSLAKLIRRHIDEEGAEEIDHVEGVGAINFLTIDDISAYQEGECLNPDSIVPLEHKNGKPIFSEWSTEKENAFLKKINRSGEKWVVIVDWQHNPSWVMDADGFLRAAMFDHPGVHPIDYCHEPILVTDKSKKLGEILQML